MNRNDKAASARAALVAALAATGWFAMQSTAHAGAFCPSKDGYTVLYARCEVSAWCKLTDPVYYSQPILIAKGKTSSEQQAKFQAMAEKAAGQKSGAYYGQATGGCYDNPDQIETDLMQPMRQKNPNEKFVLLRF